MINYTLDDTKSGLNERYKDRINNVNLYNLKLSMQPFTDERRSKSYLKEEIFKQDNNNEVECYNREYKYRNLIVSDTMTELLANHINSMKIFKEVYFNDKEKADLYMTGKITSFAAHYTIDKESWKTDVMIIGIDLGVLLIGGRNGAAAAGVMAAEAPYNSYYDYEIKYEDIVIYNQKGTVLCRLPEFTSKGREHLDQGPYSSCDNSMFYYTLNDQLKCHNDLFIKKICNELAKRLQS
ncbi:MAG: hypothetical protein ABSD50_04960 [Smithella sp.]|jgi:hypothetical protein